MPNADEVIERARRLAGAAFDDLSAFSGVDTDFAHAVLDAWYEREQHEAQSAGVDYFRRQAAFHLLLGLTCLPGAHQASRYAETAGGAEERSGEVNTVRESEPGSDATPVAGIPRPDRPADAPKIPTKIPTKIIDKLSRRDRRRRG